MSDLQTTSHAAWLVDLDGTLYRQFPVRLAMALQLLLFGLGKASLLRHFRHEHERVRELGLEGDPFTIQIIRTAEAFGRSEAEVRACVGKQWFRFALGRLERDADACSFQRLNQDFAAADYDVRALLLSLVSSDAFRYRKAVP